MKTRALSLLLLCISGCAFGYARLNEPAGADTRPDAEVRVWTHDRLLRLHGTTMLLDSITGIPTSDPLSCDYCRVGIPLTEVDSVFTQRGSAKDLKDVGKALLAQALMYLL